MKKALIRLLPGVLLLSFPTIAFAQSQSWDSCLTPQGVATLNCIPIIFSNLINWILIFAIIIAVFFIIYAGFKLVTSGGDEKKVSEARQTLTYAILGLIIILASFGIIGLVSYFTRVDCLTNEFGFDNCK